METEDIKQTEIEEQDLENSKQEDKDSKKKKKKRMSWKSKYKDLQEEYEELEEEYNVLKDKNLRIFAEFDNYKKRSVKEKVDFMKTAGQETLKALLPVLDDFDRAKESAEDESSSEVFTEGVTLVYQKLYSILGQLGVKQMETDGEVFDPELHEAVTHTPAPSEEMKGKILYTAEKGYFIKDKILRHAKVVVGK